MNKIVPILHNVRSLHNVGSVLRTCDGLGIRELWVSGYTPYPETENDQRLPHISKRATKQITKTALGAEQNIKILHFDTFKTLAKHSNSQKFSLVAVEQANGSIGLDQFEPSTNTGLVFGNEVDGLEPNVLELCQQIVELPMKGKKESFNVSVAAGIVLYTSLNRL